jgi:hypothetical protein
VGFCCVEVSAVVFGSPKFHCQLFITPYCATLKSLNWYGFKMQLPFTEKFALKPGKTATYAVAESVQPQVAVTFSFLV